VYAAGIVTGGANATDKINYATARITFNLVTATLGYDFESLVAATDLTGTLNGNISYMLIGINGLEAAQASYRLLYEESANVFAGVTNFGTSSSATADTTAVKALGSGAVGNTVTALGTSAMIILHDGQFSGTPKRELWSIGSTAGTLSIKNYWNTSTWTLATP
jgi:hypothetical protein